MQINVSVTDANNIVCEVVPPQPQVIVIDRGVEGNGIVSIVPVTISTFQYLRITYTNGTVQDVGPLTSTAYTATSPITIVGNTISLATVPIASGGTDATTAAGAIQNLLPSYTGNANKRLGLNSGGTALEWVADGGGTVTSINASGGTTGLTFSGGPITSSGTLTLSGTLAIANGGTGQITANAAFNALAPSQTGNAGKYLTTDGTDTSWATNPLGTVTSVAATVPSFLSVTGSPITTSGTLAITYSGTALPIANGGTGQTTANAALNALLPTQTGNASKYLQTDGTNATWDAISLSTADITGILPTANGGTGLSSFTVNGVVYASSSSALTTGSALTFDGTRLTSTTGKFGSGAASNSASLMVNNATNTATGIQLFQDGIESWIMGMPANSAGLAWSASGSEQMRLTATGLGIGTSSVGYKLQVFSGSSGATSAFTSTNATAYSATSYNGATARILLQGGAASGAANGIEFTQGGSSEIFFGQVQESTGTGAFVWQGYDGSYYVERARLSGAGNFGVGTTTPAVKIHSQGQSSAATIELLRLSNIGAGANTASQLTFWAAGTNYADIIGGYGSSAPRLSFNVAGGGYQSWAIDGSDKLFLNTYGHFGVGTTSPVSNGGNSAGLVHISTSTVDGWAINHYTNGTTGFNSADGLIVGNIASDAYIFNYENANVIFGTNSGEKARITASGDFGIGTSTPTTKLDVIGGVRVGGMSGATGNKLYFDTTSGAGANTIGTVNNYDLRIECGRGATSSFTAATNSLDFQIGGSEVGRFTSTGLGIGTSSPAQKLHIKSSGSTKLLINSSDNSANRGVYFASSTDSDVLGYISQEYSTGNFTISAGTGSYAVPMIFRTGGSERMRLDSSGNLGLSANGTSFQWTSSGNNVAINATSGVLSFYTGTAAYNLRATLDSSGNLGIGTSSPAYKLDVNGAANTSFVRVSGVSGAATSTGLLDFSSGYTRIISAGASAGAYGGFRVYRANGGVADAQLSIDLDSSGNLGLGVTPSAWDTAYQAIQLPNGGTLAGYKGSVAPILNLSSNAYYNSGDKYVITAAATQYSQNQGVHKWFNAPSGTAGNAITFTQAMTLDASGNLVLGTTSSLSATSGRTDLTINGSNTAILSLGVGGVRQGYLYTPTTGVILTSETNTLNLQTSASYPIVFNTNATERARIDSSGNLLIGTTSVLGTSPKLNVLFDGEYVWGQTIETSRAYGTHLAIRNTNGLVGYISSSGSTTSYNTSSDYRLKNTIAPMTGALAKVALLKPCTYKWNSNGSDGEGFIAHELAEVVPQCVTGEKDGVNEDGTPKYQGIDTSFLVATLTAAIQELKAEFDAYKASHP